MAQDIVGSLFGVAQPVDYADQDYRAAVALANANSPKQMGRFLGGLIGAPLGRVAGQAIGGLFGAEDPRLKQQRLIEQAKQQGFDTTSPEGLQQLGQFFIQNNAPELASRTALLRNQMLESQATIQQKTQEKLSNTARMLTERGLVPGTPEFQAEMTKAFNADIIGKARGDGSTTNVTIDAGSLAKAMGVDVGKQAANIEGKYSAIDSIKEAQAKLKSGIYSGAYGPEQMAAAKYSLGAVGSKQRVANTEEYMAYIGNVVIPRLSEFGGSDSNEELAYLRKVMAGEQRLEPKAQERILQSALTKIQRGIERVQSQTQAAGKKAPPPLGPGPSREAATKPKKVFNPATGRIEVQQ